LQVSNGKITTNSGEEYLKLKKHSAFIETALTIDDSGVVRLSGVVDNVFPP